MKLSPLIKVVFTLLILQACSATNNVAHNGIIQKRKHTKGFHWNLGNKKLETQKTAERPKLLTKEPEISTEFSTVANQKKDSIFYQTRVTTVQNTTDSKTKSAQKATHLKRREQVRGKVEKKISSFFSKENVAEKEKGKPTDTFSGKSNESEAYLAGLLSVLSIFFFWTIIAVPVSMGLAVLAMHLGSKYRDEDGKGKKGYEMGVVTLAIWISVIISFFGFFGVLAAAGPWS